MGSYEPTLFTNISTPFAQIVHRRSSLWTDATSADCGKPNDNKVIELASYGVQYRGILISVSTIEPVNDVSDFFSAKMRRKSQNSGLGLTSQSYFADRKSPVYDLPIKSIEVVNGRQLTITQISHNPSIRINIQSDRKVWMQIAGSNRRFQTLEQSCSQGQGVKLGMKGLGVDLGKMENGSRSYGGITLARAIEGPRTSHNRDRE